MLIQSCPDVKAAARRFVGVGRPRANSGQIKAFVPGFPLIMAEAGSSPGRG
jgi:hypothetical protein